MRVRDVPGERVDAVYAAAFRVAAGMIGASSDQARDVAQEATARALANWEKIGSYAEPWAARVAANVVIGMWRRTRRATELPAPSNIPITAELEVSLDLRRALMALPRRQREVVVLRYLGDRSIEEVAETLGVSAGTVAQHAHRGLNALKGHLGATYPLTLGRSPS